MFHILPNRHIGPRRTLPHIRWYHVPLHQEKTRILQIDRLQIRDKDKCAQILRAHMHRCILGRIQRRCVWYR